MISQPAIEVTGASRAEATSAGAATAVSRGEDGTAPSIANTTKVCLK